MAINLYMIITGGVRLLTELEGRKKPIPILSSRDGPDIRALLNP